MEYDECRELIMDKTIVPGTKLEIDSTMGSEFVVTDVAKPPRKGQGKHLLFKGYVVKPDGKITGKKIITHRNIIAIN